MVGIYIMTNYKFVMFRITLTIVPGRYFLAWTLRQSLFFQSENGLIKKPKKFLFFINSSIQNLINFFPKKMGSVLSRHLIYSELRSLYITFKTL